MKIKIWGTRGSLVTPGLDTVKYGGNTTCLEIRLNDGSLIIIDAGSGIHKLGNALLKEKELSDIYLLLTHAHWDHLNGFPFFKPAYLEKYVIHVGGGPCPQECLKRYLEHQMAPPYFPVEFGLLRAKFNFSLGKADKISIGSSAVIPVPLSHPNGGYGFKIVEGDKSFVFLTDNELSIRHEGGLEASGYRSFCRGADLLFHDAQYTEEEYQRTKGWGHSTFAAAARLGIDSQVKRMGIVHHDPDRTDTDLDREITCCKSIISREKSRLDFFGVWEGMSLTL